MITPGQCRAARAWLNLPQQELASLAGVSRSMIKDFEGEQRTPTKNNLKALVQVFVQNGIDFTNDAGFPQVGRKTGES